jgi:cytochrome P450
MSALPKASLGESVRILATGVLPALVRGLFSPRKRAMKLLTALDTDRRAVEVLSAIRRRHDGQGVRILGGRMAVLWGTDALREVLDNSADLYASDGGAKGKGMCHFQPDALTISRGEEWRDRRAFNESVLAGSERIHPCGERFLAVVADEVERLPRDGELDWSAFEELFDHLTLRVIFGDRAREDTEVTARLEKLMRQANRIAALSESSELYTLHGELERYLRDPEPGSLVARFAEAPQTDVTRVVHQIPHWMFAMRDTLGANTCRALAAIVSSPAIERRVRAELGDGEHRYLEACLEEAMRLWPTTPLLARETTRDTTLCGESLEEGTQVLILNAFNHRDTVAVPDADRFRPERWAHGPDDYRFNHLSHGTQDCPGAPMVRLLGKAVLARLLERSTFTLRAPQLDASRPVPHMLDFFAIRFAVSPREPARSRPTAEVQHGHGD